MPKSTKSTPRRAKSSIGPLDVELVYTGTATAPVNGIPSRDLRRADVDRLVFRRTVPEPGARGLRRGEKGFNETRAKVVAELTATGHFEKRS